MVQDHQRGETFFRAIFPEDASGVFYIGLGEHFDGDKVQA